MAYLTAATLSGLPGRSKSFAEQFDEGLNVLWGMNGSGKTTLLKVLHSALANDATTLVRLAFASAEVELVMSEGTLLKRELERSYATTEANTADDESELDLFEDIGITSFELINASQTLHWEQKVNAQKTYPKRPIRHRYLPVSRIFEFRTRLGRSPQSSSLKQVLDEVEYDQVFAHQIQTLWNDHHANALYQTRRAQQEAITQILGAALSTKDEAIEDLDTVSSEDAQRLVTNFVEANKGLRRHVDAGRILDEYETNPQLARVVKTITQVQQRVEADLAPENRFEETLNSMLTRKKVNISGPRELKVSSTSSNEEIPIESLSSGEKQLMRILLETLIAGKSPVLVDEPEISLHVDWQAALLEAMTYINPEAQLIIATHSPEIVGNRKIGKVIEV